MNAIQLSNTKSAEVYFVLALLFGVAFVISVTDMFCQLAYQILTRPLPVKMGTTMGLLMISFIFTCLASLDKKSMEVI
jgi:predicted transporter